MKHWIKRTARVMAILSFFTVFFLSIDPSDIFNTTVFFAALCKGGAGALLFWAAGFVVADIVIKGLVTDMRTDFNDKIDGGLLQRLHSAQSLLTPGVNTDEPEGTLPADGTKNTAHH